MRLLEADFVFDDWRALFLGDKVHVQKFSKGGWVAVGDHPNKWTSKRDEDVDVITGRELKPNVADAKRAIEIVAKRDKGNGKAATR